MYKESGWSTGHQVSSDDITVPYDIVVRINQSAEDQEVLRKWTEHFQKKMVPFAVLTRNSAPVTSKIIVQRAC